MKFFLPFALLSPLATVSAQGAMECTASIETRTIDMMKTETQWVNNEETETLKLDRVDTVVFNIQTNVDYFFSGDEYSGPGVYVEYCIDADGTKVYPDWGSEDEERRRMTIGKAKFGHVLKPLHERPGAAAPSVADAAKRSTRTLQDFPDDFPTPTEEDLETCIANNPECAPLLSGDSGPTCDGSGSYQKLLECVECKGDVEDFLQLNADCCTDPNSSAMCAFLDGGSGGDPDGHDDHGDHDGHDDHGDHDGHDDHGDHDEDEDEDDGPPVCFIESGCPEPPDAPDCAWLRGTMTCIEASSASCSETDDAIFDKYDKCLCEGECGQVIDKVDSVISPLDWKDPHLSSELHTGTSMSIPGYRKDAFGKFFRFDMNDLQDSQWNKNPWDMFSPFSDMKYEWDETSSSCKPYVKYSQEVGEEFVELVEIDGVNADCAIRYGVAEKFEYMANKGPNDHHYYDLVRWDHETTPLTLLRDTRSILRKSSGAAPPTEYDSDTAEITLTLKASDGTEYTSTTQLTYKKYMAATSNAEARWRKSRDLGGKCTQVPIVNKLDGSVYDGPYDPSPPNWADSSTVARPTIVSPESCPRMEGGQATPRVEVNSRDSALASIDKKKFINARVVRKTSAIDGKEEKSGFVEGLAQMKGCKLYVDGIFNAQGEQLCQNLNFGLNGQKEIPIKEPDCDYPELKNTAALMTATLEKMKTGKAPNDAGLLLPYIGSDSWGSCSFLIDQALTFLEVPKNIKTMACNHDWDTPEWNADPCCNWMLSETQCCAPRDVTVMVPEASVDTERLSEYCASDVQQLSIAIYAAKSFVKGKKDAVDPTYGCVGDRKSDLQKYEVLQDAAKTCADELYGTYDHSTNQHKSSKVCTKDTDCHSGTCAAAAAGETIRYCQTSMIGEHSAKCLMKEFLTIPLAQAKLKEITANGNLRASMEDVGDGILSIAGREMCTGPDGWNYDPNWLNCKGEWVENYECSGSEGDGCDTHTTQTDCDGDSNCNWQHVRSDWVDQWNDATGVCDEYWCNDKEDCKTKCLSTDAVCNTDPWNDNFDADSCVNGELNDKFCAMCWSGDNDCHEVSQAPKCYHDRRIWDQWHASEFGEWTDALCTALMGSDAVVETENCDSDFCTQSCQLPTATSAALCINAGGICDTIGYTDTYGCFVEKPRNGDCWSDIDYVEVERAECHGSTTCEGFYTETDCDGGDSCHWSTWTEQKHYHEHWLEVTRHNWQPFCKYEMNFQSLVEAEAGCPAGTTPQLSEAKENRCQHDQMCFSSDIAKADCEDWDNMSSKTDDHFSATGNCWCQDTGDDTSLTTESTCVDFQGTCRAHDSANDGDCGGITSRDSCNDSETGCWFEQKCHWNRATHVNWDSDMNLCRVNSQSMWGTLAEQAAFASECNSFSEGGTWALKMAKQFEEGRFYTEELCTAGVCDQDPGGWMGLTDEDCVNTESCSDWNCNGCERDWDNSNSQSAPDRICWAAAANQTHCTDKYSGTWTSTNNDDGDMYCLIEEHSSPERCSYIYSQCSKMDYEQCGGGSANGEFDNVVTKDVLYCRPTKWAECKSEEDCVAQGFCQNEWGGNALPDGWWNPDTSRHEYKDSVCVAPEINLDSAGNDQDWFSCDAYGSGWDEVEWSELGCVIKTITDESVCTTLTLGSKPANAVWRPTQFDAANCYEPEKCYNGNWYNRYNQEECAKCGDQFKPLLKWSGNKWMQGQMRSMYKWKDREFTSPNSWVTEIDRWMVEDLVNEVINRLNEEVETNFVSCMYNPLINSIEKIACVCGNNRDQCDQDTVINAPTSLVDTKSYRDAKQRAGKKLGTRLEVSEKSVDNTADVKVTKGLYVPPLREGTGTADASRRPPNRDAGERKLNGDSENSLNSAECMTVVTNADNWLVGQLVGDCISLSIAEDGADTEFLAPSLLCIDTNTQIERSEVFTISGLANKEGDVYTIADDMQIIESGTQFCFNVTKSVTACPIIYASEHATATEDLASGECGLISDIVQEIAMKQGCKMGDNKSCGWLQAGSLSQAAAIGTGIIVLLVIVGCCCSSCIGAWLHPKSRAVMQKHLNKAFFSEFDKDGDGMLDKDEIKVMLEKEFGEKFSVKQLDALFSKFDKDGNGQLDFEEYKVMMRHHKVHGHPPELQNDIDPSSIELLSLKPKESSM
ncbi:hypothetical protein TrVE_jg5558 [Triparma verrucosa]|uniref:EF-hand domain-containing protein n=1 Tax=Triparma verrucosa TaxID=1606542 RepID=A0A9W7B3V0_9STRA|nr:hypothetical protein TrVE_jg5558 [Triparma verrucosa]